MRLHKKLTIGGIAVALVDADVRLALFSPGRAVFTVNSAVPLHGLVQLDIGYRLDKLQRFFIGYVSRATSVDDDRQRLFCRELCGALVKRLPINQRYAALPAVLQTIAETTGLRFVTATAPYTTTKAPAVYTWGSGYSLLDSLGTVFAIPKYLWQQQGDGQVYVGSWQDSFWASRPFSLPPAWQVAVGVKSRARLPCIPRVRPGLLLNGHYLTHVGLDGNFMNVTWSQDPWKTI